MHVSADLPSSYALQVGADKQSCRAFLINFCHCLERVRIKAADQSEVMQYLTTLADGVVVAALQKHKWY